MTKKIIIKSSVILLILTLGLIFVQSPSFAGSFSASAGKTTLTVGETTSFTATANGCGGKFTVSSSNSSVVSVEGSLPWIENGSEAVTIKANKAGTATITLTAANVADSATAEDIEGSKSITITVKEKEQQPDTSGANLKSITVAGKTYNNPGTDFTVTVGANVNSAEVSAVASSSGAKISGTGSKELVTGTNTVTITVTATNGATKKYTIRVRKLADTTTTPNVVDNNPNNNNQETPPEEEEPKIEDVRLTYLRIEDVELIPAFESEVFEYAVSVTNIDKLDIVAVANFEDAQIAITGNENFVEGENEILITVTKEGQEGVIYRIVVTKTVEEVAPIAQEEDNGGVGGFLEKPGAKAAISVGGAGAVGILGYIIYRIKGGADMASRAARRAAVRRSTFNDFDD